MGGVLLSCGQKYAPAAAGSRSSSEPIYRLGAPPLAAPPLLSEYRRYYAGKGVGSIRIP